MGARLKTPIRLNMRHPLNRAMLFSICMLFFLSLLLRPESSFIGRRLFGGSHDRKTKHINEIVALDDDPLSPSPFMDVELDPISTHEMDCTIDATHLAELRKRHDLSYTVQYLKRYVRFKRTEGLQRAGMTKVNQTLVSGKFKTVQVGRKYQKESCPEPLELPVPKSSFPATVNASDFIFGVSTSYERFMNPDTTPIGEWIYWLTDSHGHTNGAHLVLMLIDATDHQLQEVANLLGDVGINVDVFHSDSGTEMAVRYVTLVPTLFTHREASKKKWLVTCDDDTFFPSMHGLIEKLKTYDADRPMYIGTLSEDAGAVERHGSQAFGGAGVFLTLPLAEKIAEHYEDCVSEKNIHKANSGWGAQGDILLRNCIYGHTDTRLSNLWDLWQLDFLGDPSGFYEWGHKPLSLHHYRGRGWHLSRPVAMTKIAHTCGEDCTMIRFSTPDNFIVSGYSVAQYPEGMNFDHRHDNPFVDPEAATRVVGNDYFVRLGADAQRRSYTLLKNKDNILPLRNLARGTKFYIEGFNSTFVEKRNFTVVKTPEEADYALLRIQAPYEQRTGVFEANMNAGSLAYNSTEQERQAAIYNTVPTIADIILDRPAVIPEVIEKASAVFGSYGSSSEAFLDVILGESSPEGKLPFDLPSSIKAVEENMEDVPFDTRNPIFKFGHGLTYANRCAEAKAKSS